MSRFLDLQYVQANLATIYDLTYTVTYGPHNRKDLRTENLVLQSLKRTVEEGNIKMMKTFSWPACVQNNSRQQGRTQRKDA